MKCSVSGGNHSWWKCGLDVVKDRLVRVRRCSWCGVSKTLPYS